jgi:hypothetical protein
MKAPHFTRKPHDPSEADLKLGAKIVFGWNHG